MPQQRRGFASINSSNTQQTEQKNDAERIEALEARLVKRFQDALAQTAAGKNDTAKELLWQLLQEPLLQQQGRLHEKGVSATAALQSRVLQGMHYKVLSSLAPLLGQSPEALDIWCKIIEQDATNAKAWEESGIILAHMGQLQSAVQAADIALQLKPDNVVLLERLIVLYAACSDWSVAGQLLLDLARATGACHHWLQGLSQVTPRATGFSQSDIEHCLQDQFGLVTYLAQQAKETANRVHHQQHEQPQLLTKSLQVSGVCDLLQQLLQVLRYQFQRLNSASSPAGRSVQGISSPHKDNIQSPRISSQGHGRTTGRYPTADDTLEASNTCAATAVAAVAPALQLRVCYVAAAAEHGIGNGRQVEASVAAPQPLGSFPAQLPPVSPNQEGQLLPSNSEDGAIGSCTQHQSIQQKPVEQSQQQQQQQQQSIEPLGQSSDAPKNAQVAGTTTAPSGKHSARPAAAAPSGTGKGAHGSKAPGQQVHKPFITALQIVKEVVGRWLPCGSSATGSTATQAIKSDKTSPAQALKEQHQQLQPPPQLVNAHHVGLFSSSAPIRHTGAVAAAGTFAGEADSSKADSAVTWEQYEQVLLRKQSLQPYCLPLHLTVQLLKDLLTAAEQLQLPTEVCQLILQLAQHIPVKTLSHQHHLVLAELYLDAAMSVKAAGQGVEQHSAVGAQRAAASANGVAVGTNHTVVPFNSKKRPHAAAAVVVPSVVQSQALEDLNGALGGSAAAAARQLAGEAEPSAQNSAADDTPPSKRPNTGRLVVRQRRQKPQNAAETGTAKSVDAGAASAGQSRAEKRLEQLKADAIRQQQQHKVEQHVQQLLHACEKHLQHHEAARAYSHCIGTCAAHVSDPELADATDADGPVVSLWCNGLWTDASEPHIHSLCVLKQLWIQKVTGMCSQQQPGRVSNNGVLAAQMPAPAQQQQQAPTVRKQPTLDPAWLRILGGNTSVGSDNVPTMFSSHDNGGSAGANSSCSSTSCWGPSATGWHAATYQEQQQQQQPAGLSCILAPDVMHEEWGPVLKVPVVQTAASKALHPAVVGAASAAACGTESHRLGVITLENYLQQAQQDAQLMDWQRGSVLEPLQPDGTCAASTEAATATEEADLRRCWVLTRLKEAQDDLEAADAASQQCLSWLAAAAAADMKSRQANHRHFVVDAAIGADNAAAQQVQTFEASSKHVFIQLPSCRNDGCISKTAVEQKRDCMWLKKQLAAASEQLLKQEQLYKQLQQQLSGSADQRGRRTQHEHEQLSQQLERQDGCLQIRQLVKEICSIADSVFELLSQRCLKFTPQDEMTDLKLSGIRLLQRATNRASAAVDAVQVALSSHQAQQDNKVAGALLQEAEWLRPLQQQQTHLRLTELQSILLQLHRALCLHSVPESPSHGAAYVSSRGQTPGAANTAAQVMHCLRDLNRFWDNCRQKPSGFRSNVTPSSKQKAQPTAAEPSSKQHQQTGELPQSAQEVQQHEHHKEDAATALHAGLAGDSDKDTADAAQAGAEGAAAPEHDDTAAASMVSATAALAVSKARESLQPAEKLLLQELKLDSSLLSLLEQVQHLLQELLAARCLKQIDFSAIVGAAVAGAAVGCKQPATAGVAAAGGAAVSGRARAARSKRQRHVPSADAGEAAAGTTTAAVDASALAALRGGSGRGLHGHGKLNLAKSQGRVLLQEAAYGLLAVHELDPRVSGNTESVLGMVEGLYGLLSLRVSAVDEALTRFMKAAWHRLKLVFYQLLHQQDQHTVQQQLLLVRVDEALAHLLRDLHGLNLPWRSRTFGLEPIVTAIAAAAAQEVASAVMLEHATLSAVAPGASEAVIAKATLQGSVAAEIATAAAQSCTATLEQPQVQAVDAEAIAAASLRAIQQLYAMRREDGVQPSTQVKPHSIVVNNADGLGSPLFKCPEIRTLGLEDLMEVWTYVSVRASPGDIRQNHRIMQRTASPTGRKSKKYLLTAATAAAAALINSTLQQQHQAEAASEQRQRVQLPVDQAAAMTAAAGPQRSTTGSDESESDGEGEDELPTSVLGMEEQFWQQLQQGDKNIIQQLLQQLPPPPAKVMAASAGWLADVLDSTQQQLEQQSGAEGSKSVDAVELLLSNSIQSRLSTPAVSVGAASSLPAAAEAASKHPERSSSQMDGSMADAEAATAYAVDAVMADAQDEEQPNCTPSAPTVSPAVETASNKPTDQLLVNPVYGWTAEDLQMVVGERPVPACQAPSPAELVAADSLYEVHSLLYHAAGFNAPELTAASLDDGPSAEVTEYERLLLWDLAVRPTCIRPWQRLAELYSGILQASQSGLLERATERANADSWHAALSVKHWGGKVHSSQRWQQLQMLQHFSRRALRCAVMTAHLLQKEQQQQQQHDQPSSELRDEEDKFVVSDQIDQLGVMLRDAAMCLGPWYEPYAHRPDKSTARPLLLRAAESCFCRAQQLQESGEWQFSYVLGQTAAKVKAPGWQAKALRYYALACYQSHIKAQPQSAVLLPYVKLHSTRLKLLTCAVSQGNMLTGLATCSSLLEFLNLLKLLGRWCFGQEARTKFSCLLGQLHQSALLQASVQVQQQQALMTQLQQLVCRQVDQQQAAAGGHMTDTQEQLLQPWHAAVNLLLGDCCAALRYFQDCCSRPLVPARYSLARGLVKLGRFEEAFTILEGLFKLSGSFGIRNSAMPFLVSFLLEEGDIKPSYQPHARKQQHHDDTEEDVAEAAVPVVAGAASRKRRRISSTAAVTAAAASSGPRPSRDAEDPSERQQSCHIASPAAPAAAVDASEETTWGLCPDVVRGWGEDESVRQFNARNRRALLLYLKVLALKKDLILLEQAYQGLLGRVGNLNGLLAQGLQPKDLGDLAVGLLLRQLLVDLAPAVQQYQQAWQQQGPSAGSGEEAGQSIQPGPLHATASGLQRAVAHSAGQDVACPSQMLAPAGGGASAVPVQSMPCTSREPAFLLQAAISTDSQHQLQVLIEAVTNTLCTSSEAAGNMNSSLQQERVLVVLERAFVLYVTWLQMMAPGDDERCLQLGGLLAAADEFLGRPSDDSTAAGAAAATLVRSLRNNDQQLEQLLQLLAHAYVATPAYHLRQQQQSAGVAALASTCPALIDRLKQAAKSLKERNVKSGLKLSVHFQRCAKLMQSVCRHTAQQLLLVQQLYCSAAAAAVQQHLAAETPELEALVLVPQQQPKHSTVSSAIAAAQGVPQQQQQQSDAMQVDMEPEAAADAEGNNTVLLGKRRSLTPVPASPGDVPAEVDAATPEPPAAATTAAQTRATTPAQTPSGVAVEGRRSRRAAAVAAAGGQDQPPGTQTSTQQSSKVSIVFNNPCRIAAVKAVLSMLKTVHHDFKQSNLASNIDDGKQYMHKVYKLVIDLLELAARAAGLPVPAVADGQTTPPNSDARAYKVLQVAINCLGDLLKGVATRQVVNESRAAVARVREQQQQPMEAQGEAEAEQQQDQEFQQQCLEQQREAEQQHGQDQQQQQEEAVEQDGRQAVGHEIQEQQQAVQHQEIAPQQQVLPGQQQEATLQQRHLVILALRAGLPALVRGPTQLQPAQQQESQEGLVENSATVLSDAQPDNNPQHQQHVSGRQLELNPAASSLLQTFPQQQQQQSHLQGSHQSDTTSPSVHSADDSDVMREQQQPAGQSPSTSGSDRPIVVGEYPAAAAANTLASQRTATAAECLSSHVRSALARAKATAAAQVEGPSGGGAAGGLQNQLGNLQGNHRGADMAVGSGCLEQPQSKANADAVAAQAGAGPVTKPAGLYVPADASLAVGSGQQAREALAETFSGRGQHHDGQQPAVSGSGRSGKGSRSRSRSRSLHLEVGPTSPQGVVARCSPLRAQQVLVTAAFPKPQQVEASCNGGTEEDLVAGAVTAAATTHMPATGPQQGVVQQHHDGPTSVVASEADGSQPLQQVMPQQPSNLHSDSDEAVQQRQEEAPAPEYTEAYWMQAFLGGAVD